MKVERLEAIPAHEVPRLRPRGPGARAISGIAAAHVRAFSGLSASEARPSLVAPMAFDLKRVLQVMLFASNGPLSVKDIQSAFARFHEQSTSLPFNSEAAAAPADGAAEAGAEVIIGGCTEVPLLLRAEESPVPLTDSAEVLARACVEMCG